MRAVVFEKNDLNDLRVVELSRPRPNPHEVVIRVTESGVNPVDYYTVTSRWVKPIPHIPGAEFAGIVEEVGEHVSTIKPGDKVVVYGRVFDGTCDLCLASMENLCRNGGIMGIITNGGWAEYAVVPDRNIIKLPDDANWDLAASLPVAALTSYHALREANLKVGETLVVFGASGNTGQFAVQLGKLMGARVIAVSGKSWVSELGADYVASINDVKSIVEKITEGKMADVVVDPLGESTWNTSISLLGRGGRWVTFGQLTGGEVKIQLSLLYSNQLKLIGSTGGTRRELLELVSIMSKLKVKVDKYYELGEAKEALTRLFSPQRNGRIIIKISV